MKSEKLLIDGMSCQHCVMAVKKELSKLNLKINDVQIGWAEIEYEEKKISRAELKEAIKEAGYILND